jgi:hypothetical protein
MSDRAVREALAKFLQSRIMRNLDKIHAFINNDIRYETIYPLTFLEESNLLDAPESITNQVRRSAISWFFTMNFSARQKGYKSLSFHNVQYKKFTEKVYPFIQKVYQDHRYYLEVCDHNSYARSIFEEIDSNKWRLKTSFVENHLQAESFYFHRLFDPAEAEIERRKTIELREEFGKEILFRMSGAKSSEENKSLVELVQQRIEMDLRFLGGNPISSVITDYNGFKRVLSSIYYIAHLKLSETQLLVGMKGKFETGKLVVVENKDEFIERVVGLSDISEAYVRQVINYLSLKIEGGLLQFPLIELDRHYVFNPASVIVNDWHFGLVDGHYCRSLDFINRDEMISSKVVSLLEDSTKNVTNVATIREKYYEFVDENGTKKNSDIDIGIYDINSNKLLIIECKWKVNHFVSEIDYDHKKIQQSLFRINQQQISKHRKYLSTKSAINEAFNNDTRVTTINDMPDIEYIVVDKRNQLFLNGEIMMSVYMLVTFINNFKRNKTLALDKVIELIRSMETKTSWFQTSAENEILIDGLIVLSDDIEPNSSFVIA